VPIPLYELDDVMLHHNDIRERFGTSSLRLNNQLGFMLEFIG